MLLKTGIPKIDDLLGGGLPSKMNFLVIGPPSSRKDTFLMEFLFSGKKVGEPGVFITTDTSPEEIEKKTLSFGMDFGGAIKFVDCYSWALQSRGAGRASDIIVPGPSSLNELSIAISKAILQVGKPGIPTRTSFQSLSTLILYNNPEIIFRFIQVMGARMKQSGATTFFSIEEGMHQPGVLTTLEHLTDGTIEFKTEGGKEFVRFPRLPTGTPIVDWLEFESGHTG